jgi:hypothetical protein
VSGLFSRLAIVLVNTSSLENKIRLQAGYSAAAEFTLQQSTPSTTTTVENKIGLLVAVIAALQYRFWRDASVDARAFAPASMLERLHQRRCSSVCTSVDARVCDESKTSIKCITTHLD